MTTLLRANVVPAVSHYRIVGQCCIAQLWILVDVQVSQIISNGHLRFCYQNNILLITALFHWVLFDCAVDRMLLKSVFNWNSCTEWGPWPWSEGSCWRCIQLNVSTAKLQHAVYSGVLCSRDLNVCPQMNSKVEHCLSSQSTAVFCLFMQFVLVTLWNILNVYTPACNFSRYLTAYIWCNW